MTSMRTPCYASSMPESSRVLGMRRQLQSYASRRARGMPRVGWKIGVNVPEVQRRLGLSEPLVGFLDGERVFEDGAAVVCPEDTRLHVEPELCLCLGTAVGPNPSVEEARAAIIAVRPALEVVNYALPGKGLEELIASAMFHHGLVLGAPLPLPSPGTVRAVAGELVFEVSGQRSPPARSDLVPGELAEIVRLMARVLTEFGESLQAGDLLMSGAFVEKALPLAAGHTARARFGTLGEVRCSGA